MAANGTVAGIIGPARLGVHAEVPGDTGAEEFHLRPQLRSAALLEPSRLDASRIDRDQKGCRP